MLVTRPFIPKHSETKASRFRETQRVYREVGNHYLLIEIETNIYN